MSRKALCDTVIRAPISGIVASRSVQPGEKVSADNKLLASTGFDGTVIKGTANTDYLVGMGGADAEQKKDGAE